MSYQILVIDDEQAIRKSFILALEEGDYSVTAVESGMKGISSVEKQEFDLIFLDLKMPGLNGVETLCEIRKRNDKVPIYIVTAFHQEFFEQLKQAWRDGLEFELLEKPILAEQIMLIVRGVLGGPINF